ncbi:MAG: Txe/YoeB family addiction module toxin [Candidatus Marinimicrobia bacterium CG_4_9_14_3_um_filter_48_9]|nr:MAG: Txe/YoeB family addiction module toxin [Candidatus Marinimicrobia bacterium CG_4_9_14_3_um_filter_48_9]
MRSIVFEGKTWSKYEELRKTDQKLHTNLCKIIQEMQREDPSRGIGKPEQLRHNLSGFWSRRLSRGDRLIYKYDEKAVYIFAIGGHYDTQ